MPSQDLRIRDWMPAEPVERYLDAVEKLAALQKDRHNSEVLR